MNRLLLPVGVLCSALCAPLSAVAGDVKYEGQTVQQWTTALTNPDAKVRRKAAYALGQIGLEAREAVPALTKALADRYLEVAWYAADALGRIGPGAAPATEALVRVIEETPGDAVLRRTATIALGRIGPDAKSALPILAKLVKSDDAETRVAAAVALGQIARDASSLPLLIAELKPTGGPGPLAAALALRSFESEQAAKALIGVLENPDADLRRAAIETLGDGGANSIGPLVTAAGDRSQPQHRPRRLGAIDALGDIALRTRGRIPIQLGGHRPEPELLSAVYDQLLPALAEQLADPDDEVQGAAARAMAKAGFLAVPSLVDGLINPTGRNAAGAQRALAQLRPNLSPSSLPIDERTLPKLVTALKHSNPAIRAAGFRLFAELGIGKSGAAAADALRAGLSDPNPDIRRHAAAALARVEE